MRQRAREIPVAEPPAPAVTPVDTLSDRDALARAMRSLPRDQALAVHLRVVEGYAFGEVGRLMNRSPAACQMLVLRAGRSLRELLE